PTATTQAPSTLIELQHCHSISSASGGHCRLVENSLHLPQPPDHFLPNLFGECELLHFERRQCTLAWVFQRRIPEGNSAIRIARHDGGGIDAIGACACFKLFEPLFDVVCHFLHSSRGTAETSLGKRLCLGTEPGGSFIIAALSRAERLEYGWILKPDRVGSPDGGYLGPAVG